MTPAGRILVVEDDESLREALVEVLGDEGHEVRAAEHGAEALEILHGGLRPQLILSDLMMPVVDGEALLAACHADPDLASIPVCILSSDVGNAVRLTRAGAINFLPKPLQTGPLLETLRRIPS